MTLFQFTGQVFNAVAFVSKQYNQVVKQVGSFVNQAFVGSDNLQLVIRENPVSPTRDVNAMRTSYDTVKMPITRDGTKRPREPLL